MKKTYIFYSLCVLCVFVFIFQFVKFSLNPKYDFKIFSYTINPINVILSADIKNDNDILIKADDDFYTIKNKRNIANKIISKRIKTLDIFVNKNFKKEIKDIIFFSADKALYFKNLSKLNSSEYRFCKNNICEEYIGYSLSEKIKNKNEILNTFSWFNIFCSFLLSLFLSNPYLLLSYCLFFYLIFYFINNKSEINFPKIKISYYLILFLIFLIGVALRFNNLFLYLPHLDEYATIDYSFCISKIFADPGNPPLFYLLYHFYLKLFDLSTYSIKCFPFVISIISFCLLFFITKKEFDRKTSLIASFLCAINIPLIYYSHELRSYIFQTMLSVLLIYYLFKILRKNNIRYYILYGFFGILAINTHYFEFLFLLFNFIFGLVFLIKNKKEFRNFIILNFVIFLSFVPFFVYCALNNALLDENFNNWISKISFDVIYKCLKLLFGGLLSFILSLIFFVKINLLKSFNLKKKLYINYCFLSIVFVFISGTIISLFRPILVDRYLVLLIPVFILFLSLIFSSDFKNKKIIILFLVWIFFLQTNTYVKNLEKKFEVDILRNFSYQYVEQNENSKQVYIILHYIDLKNSYMTKYLKINKKIKSVSILKSQLNSTIEKILNDNKNAIIYTYMGNDDWEFAQKYNALCYFNSTTDLCLFRIEK